MKINIEIDTDEKTVVVNGKPYVMEFHTSYINSVEDIASRLANFLQYNFELIPKMRYDVDTGVLAALYHSMRNLQRDPCFDMIDVDERGFKKAFELVKSVHDNLFYEEDAQYAHLETEEIKAYLASLETASVEELMALIAKKAPNAGAEAYHNMSDFIEKDQDKKKSKLWNLVKKNMHRWWV